TCVVACWRVVHGSKRGTFLKEPYPISRSLDHKLSIFRVVPKASIIGKFRIFLPRKGKDEVKYVSRFSVNAVSSTTRSACAASEAFLAASSSCVMALIVLSSFLRKSEAC